MEPMTEKPGSKEHLLKTERKLEQKINETKIDLIQWMVTPWIFQNLLFMYLLLMKYKKLKNWPAKQGSYSKVLPDTFFQ